MEMYRARIVDDLVIRLIHKQKIQPSHFICNEKNVERPVLLLDEGIKIFLEEYYRVIFKERGTGEIPYENDFLKLKIIEKNLETFKQSLVKETFDYEGFKIK
jgi:CRISPR/Cas system-associated endonuclease Cas1